MGLEEFEEVSVGTIHNVVQYNTDRSQWVHCTIQCNTILRADRSQWVHGPGRH